MGAVLLAGLPTGRLSANESLVSELAAADPDPVAVASVVRRAGDDALLALLRPEQPPGTRLLALRAAPWLREPWLAIPPIAAMVGGRDSEVSPAAARSLLAIARGLDLDSLQRKEADFVGLCAARTLLREAAGSAAVRADVQLASGAAAHLLDGLCPADPPPAPPP